MTTLERKARMRKRMSKPQITKRHPGAFYDASEVSVYTPECVPMQLPLQQPLIRRWLEGIRQLV